MLTPRVRFLSLWISQVARAVADNALRTFVVLQLADAGVREHETAWHQVTPFFILPFIVLAPLNGAISNSLQKNRILVVASGFCLLVVLWAGVSIGAEGNPWAWCAVVGCNAIGTAIYSPTRYALLPAVAEDTRIPLNRVVAWIELGGAAGIVLGMVLGLHLHGADNQSAQATFPTTISVLAALNCLALASAAPCSFSADVRRPESSLYAIAGFFRDNRRIWGIPTARAALLGQATFLGILTGGTGAVVAYALSGELHSARGHLTQSLISMSLGAGAGAFLAGLQGHPRRALGIVPFGATGLVLAFAWFAWTSDLTWPCLWLGFTGGLVNVPLRAAYQAAVPPDARGNAMAVMNTANYGTGTLLAIALFAMARLGFLSVAGQLWLLAVLAGIALAAAWRVLLREGMELILEFLIWPFYRIRACGPGVGHIPLDGPVLVIANHTAWLDPLWLGKIIPRRITPLMTSRFYDLPVLHWLMTRVVGAIRVQAGKVHKDPPELRQAIAVLDCGECVAIFPEGYMKRRPERTLSQFGQGVWRILSERPAIPVVPCWIDGGWGSFTSYAKGPPATNKRIDWWRPIRIGLGLPLVLDQDVLKDQRRTRAALMDACLAARQWLGLEPISREKALLDSSSPSADDEMD